ncbi:hypothetical protein ColTof4_04090 [Colletotrichum tofieldiae]|uniref:Uncharacterized protein n=1 Tax=Colletotrichum tofieldiae TaxID=708197 RepID=A0A161XSM9_9PEZI|nr:hypothetical protein CT0861_08797 [Colletotrichum tofieldiae]GKT66599.1 hypothetical protein ColTof3_13938 [Colletotrichum tofieldiae]GKT71667.1 hypothetical protein ColTof4_04090 [Colletotrichum tofieldiae]
MPQTQTPRTRAKVVWYCHNCGTGPNSYKLDDFCPNCQNRRCRYCTVKEIQTAIRSPTGIWPIPGLSPKRAVEQEAARGPAPSTQLAVRTGESPAQHMPQSLARHKGIDVLDKYDH